jgi:hypothetical protein
MRRQFGVDVENREYKSFLIKAGQAYKSPGAGPMQSARSRSAQSAADSAQSHCR